MKLSEKETNQGVALDHSKSRPQLGVLAHMPTNLNDLMQCCREDWGKNSSRTK